MSTGTGGRKRLFADPPGEAGYGMYDTGRLMAGNPGGIQKMEKSRPARAGRLFSYGFFRCYLLRSNEGMVSVIAWTSEKVRSPESGSWL